MNNVVLIGRLVRDPDLKYMPNSDNRPVTNFTLAVDKELSKEVKKDFESKNKPTADFIPIVVFGGQAEACAKYLEKGLMTSVHGKINTRNYTNKDGQKVYVTEVVANKIEFIEWGDSKNTNQKPKKKQDNKKDETFDPEDLFEPDDDDSIPF
jgi:single-strand DNA-binding protein